MEIRIMSQSETANEYVGGMTLEVTLDQGDIDQLKEEGSRALEIERSVPPEARTPLGNADDDAYLRDFIETRATNDSLEAHGIIPVAIPHVKSSEIVEGQPYTCQVHVHVRPDIGLTTLDPAKLSTSRVAKPGFSAQAALEGKDGIEFVDDDRVLRASLTSKLDGELSEPAMRALAEEYQTKFEAELARHNIDPQTYQVAHSLDEEQYDLMMARRSLSDAHWNYVLDAIFVGNGYTITDEDLATFFELQHTGYSEQLLELHELRNDMWMYIEKVRRGKALMWLKENVLH